MLLKFKKFLICCLVYCIAFTSSFNCYAVTASTTLAAVLATIGMTWVNCAAEDIYDTFLDSSKSWYDTDNGSTSGAGYTKSTIATSTGASTNTVYNTYSDNSVGDTTTYSTSSYSLTNYTYDTTTNTYNTSVYSPVTNEYNVVNNTYYNDEYNFYFFETNEYNYYVTNNYTYVTYMIQDTLTNDWSYLEIYYQLPDGRNSYDLTIDDVWGEYFLYNVTSYDSVPEDDGTLGLWHLDGNTIDVSYYANTGSTAYTGGYTTGVYDSSGKYMEGAFDYLSLNLNNCFFDSSSDFTLEFSIIGNSNSGSQTQVNTDLTSITGTRYYEINRYPELGYITIGSETFSSSYTDFTSVSQITYFAIQSENGVVSFFKNGTLYATGTYGNGSDSITTYSGSYQLTSDWSMLTISDNYIKFNTCTYNYSTSVGTDSSPATLKNINYCLYSSVIDEVRLTNRAIYDSSGYVPSAIPSYIVKP